MFPLIYDGQQGWKVKFNKPYYHSVNQEGNLAKKTIVNGQAFINMLAKGDHSSSLSHTCISLSI
jgi:hypothetical protein